MVSKVRAQQYAASIKAIILETSAKENYGVSDLFHRVAEKVIESRGDDVSTVTGQGMKLSPLDRPDTGKNHKPCPNLWKSGQGTD